MAPPLGLEESILYQFNLERNLVSEVNPPRGVVVFHLTDMVRSTLLEGANAISFNVGLFHSRLYAGLSLRFQSDPGLGPFPAGLRIELILIGRVTVGRRLQLTRQEDPLSKDFARNSGRLRSPEAFEKRQI